MREAQGRARPPGGPLRMEKRNEGAKLRASRFHRTILSPSIRADRPEVGPYLELRIRRKPAIFSTLFNLPPAAGDSRPPELRAER
jgi:hypothetical protein